MVEGKERTLAEAIVHYTGVFKRQWLTILLVTSLPTLLAVAFAVATRLLPLEINPNPNVYTATATILTQKQSGADFGASVLSALGVDTRMMGASGGTDVGSLILQVLGSRMLIDRAIDEFRLTQRYRITENIKARTRARFQSKFRTDYTRSTGALVLSYTDTDPVFVKDVVNRMVSLLSEWFSQNTGSAQQRQIRMLEEKVTEVKADITRLENQLKALQTQYGVLNAQELGTSQATALADLRSQLILKEIEIKNYQSFSVVDDPKLQQLNEERQTVVDLIDRIQKGAPEDLRDGSTAAPTKTLPEVAQQFSQLTNELEIQKQIYNKLTPQYQAAKLTEDTEPLFQVLEYAEVPDMKSGPNRTRVVVLVAVCSLVLSFVIALAREALGAVLREQGPDMRPRLPAASPTFPRIAQKDE